MSCRFRKEESSSEDGSDMNEFTKADFKLESGHFPASIGAP